MNLSVSRPEKRSVSGCGRCRDRSTDETEKEEKTCISTASGVHAWCMCVHGSLYAYFLDSVFVSTHTYSRVIRLRNCGV